MTAVITTRGLVKRFGRLRAVDGIDLDVRTGDIYGFLGANGSGKTTTVRMLLGLVLPTSEIELLGGRMPRAGRRVLRAWARSSRAPPTTATSPGGRTWRCSTPPARWFLRTRRARIDEVLEQWGWPRSAAAR